MENKKGFVLTIPILIAVVLLIVIILIFTVINKFAIIGGGIMVLAFIFAIPAALQGEFTARKVIFLVFLFLIGGGIIAIPYLGILEMTAFPSGTGNLKLAIPHMASFRCEEVGASTGIVRTIPKGGLYLSDTTIGVHTNKITNIELKISQSAWSAIAGLSSIRLVWEICDIQTGSCNTYDKAYNWWGVYDFPLSSLDLTKNTMNVWTEKGSLWLFWRGFIKVGDIGSISYDAEKWGLRLYSTARDPAGEIICSTSCDLDCPPQEYRNKLLYTTANSVYFYETAPYLEYWEDISYDLNQQGGATIYDEVTQKFCFSGTLYDAGIIKTDDGTTYVYPMTNTRIVKSCCPGAVISIVGGEKICQPDYTWLTITKEQETGEDCIECISDINCPGGGDTTCQLIDSKYYTSGWRCGANKCCIKEDMVEVECCPPDIGCAKDQTCQAGKCVGGTRDVPIDEAFNATYYAGLSTAQEACEKLIATNPARWQWVEGVDYPWYEFWKKDVPAYCKDTWMIYFILGGVGIFALIVIVLAFAFSKKTTPQGNRGRTVINVQHVPGSASKRRKFKKKKK